LRTLDVDGDGDDETLHTDRRPPRDPLVDERDVRFKAGRDVRDFSLVPPSASATRFVVVEGGDAPCLLALDGRRLASARLPAAITALDASDGAALRCGAGRRPVAHAAAPGNGRGRRTDRERELHAAAHPITALAHGAVGTGATERVVRGDANGTIAFTLQDGGGDVSLTVRAAIRWSRSRSATSTASRARRRSRCCTAGR